MQVQHPRERSNVLTTSNPVRLTAHKAKSGDPYLVTIGQHHQRVLDALSVMPDITDSDLTFLLDMHMAAPRRCELRDLGLVEKSGVAPKGMTWRLTDEGKRFLARGCKPEAPEAVAA